MIIVGVGKERDVLGKSIYSVITMYIYTNLKIDYHIRNFYLIS